jgi:hypothetical protein
MLTGWVVKACHKALFGYPKSICTAYVLAKENSEE